MANHNIKRLIIVSNRLPVTLSIKKGAVAIDQSSGGLVSSMKSYVERMKESEPQAEVIWVGSSDIAENKFETHFKADHFKVGDYTLYPVFMSTDVKDKFYNGFCNGTLWPLFHYFPSYASFKEEDYAVYKQANVFFAKKLLQVYQPGDIVWVHDYHHMILPGMLRQWVPDMALGFFLHIPFPSFELFRLLPSTWRKDILEGLLASDLIGFHTNDYVQHFLKSVRQILGYDNDMRLVHTPERSITTDAFPISIDFDKFFHSISDSKTFNERNSIKKGLPGLKTIISVDRLDYTKGIINRLEGFELFLEKYPDYIKKVTYLLVVVPSRDIIMKYRENKRQIEETVSRINGRFGEIGYTPVVYQYRSIDFNELTGLYLAADVALIVPIRDGMNLVAKEFVATRNNGSGVLILSETAGAATELGEALLVNPTDRHEIADTIYTALNMPLNEQVSRNEIMQERLRNYNVKKWAEDFMASLIHSRVKQENFNVKEVNSNIEENIQEDFVGSVKRLFLLDYDGTLTPFARTPAQAVPSTELLETLGSLGESSKNDVVIISGRPQETLDKWFSQTRVHLVAEHGAFIRPYGKPWKKTIQAETDWKHNVMPMLDLFSQRCPGAFTEQKACSVAWHYRNANPDLGFLRSRELIDILNELSVHQNFQVMEGHKVVEIRSRGIDKGAAAGNWLNFGKYDFVLAIGDDKTDEDMFKVVPSNGFSIRVGMVPSTADFNFRSQINVLPFLKKMKLLCEAERRNEFLAQ